MSIKTTLANDKSQQHDLHYSSYLFELGKTFTNVPLEMMKYYYCSIWRLKILYVVVTSMLICDLNQYAVGCIQGNKIVAFFARKYWIGKLIKMT